MSSWIAFQPLVIETHELKVTVTVECKKHSQAAAVRLLWGIRRRLPRALARLIGAPEETIKPCGCSGS